MKKYVWLTAFILVISITVEAQNLTGTWIGQGNDYKLVIIHQNDSCFGYTYDTGMGYCKANFKGIFDSTGKKLKGINTNFIERTLSHGLSSYSLNYVLQGNVEYLEGRVAPKSIFAKILSLGIGAPVRYRKVSQNIDTTLFIAEKLQQNSQHDVAENETQPRKENIPPPPIHSTADSNALIVQKNSRPSQLVNSIITGADSIKLVLFDNGEIDNDTVTVFLNGKIFIDRLGLTTRFFEKWVVFPPGNPVLHIELMANNLGSIPPNTANLVIWAGKQKYDLKVSSDYSRNAAIDIQKIPAEKENN